MYLVSESFVGEGCVTVGKVCHQNALNFPLWSAVAKGCIICQFLCIAWGTP